MGLGGMMMNVFIKLKKLKFVVPLLGILSIFSGLLSINNYHSGSDFFSKNPFKFVKNY